MQGRRVAGLAVIVSEMEPTLVAALSEGKIPVVFYDVGAPARHCAKIRTDYARGTRRVVEYLYSLGHRRLAFVGHHTALAPLHVRQCSFLEAVRDCCGDAPHGGGGRRGQPGGRPARHACSCSPSGFEPTAIVCVNDFMALGVIRALREMGLAVPGTSRSWAATTSACPSSRALR